MSLRIAETDDLRIPHALRRAVFIEEQGIPEPEEWDTLDADAVHLVAWDGARPVGTARLLSGTAGTGRITRVCVLASHRGTGLGAALIRDSLARLEAAGLSRAELSAQTYARGFYARLGFEPHGQEYDDAGIPHVAMAQRLPRAPAAPGAPAPHPA